MALPDRQWLLLLVAMMAFCAGGASKDITGGYFQYDCPVSTGPSTTRGTAFDDNLRSLMAALPSAAAPTGFASLRAGRGRALATARGLCFGDSPPPESCRDCLSQSAEIVLDACDGNRSAAVWTDGCFLAYTDGNASASATDDDVIYVAASSSNNLSCDEEEVVPLARSLVPRAAHGSSGRMLVTAYTTCQANGGGDTVHALAQCPRDAAPADCALCLDKSARTLPDSLQWSRGIPVGASSLHRYNCTMRFERSRPAPPIGRGASIRTLSDQRRLLGASPSSNDISCDAEEVVRLARSLVTRAAHGSSGQMLVTADTTCQANSDTVHALAQCPRDVAPANCALCLDKSARTLPDSLQWSQGIPVGASSLHRYNCTMRFERSPLAPPIGRGARIRKKVKDNMVVVIVGAVAIVAMISVAAFLLVKRKVNQAQAVRQLNSEV